VSGGDRPKRPPLPICLDAQGRITLRTGRLMQTLGVAL